MKQKSVYIIAWMFVVVASSSCSLIHRDRFNQGNEMIAKIENFRKEKGRLPESVLEIGMKETELEGPILYDKKSPSRYILSFMTSLDDGYAYDSDTKEWKKYPPFPK